MVFYNALFRGHLSQNLCVSSTVTDILPPPPNARQQQFRIFYGNLQFCGKLDLRQENNLYRIIYHPRHKLLCMSLFSTLKTISELHHHSAITHHKHMFTEIVFCKAKDRRGNQSAVFCPAVVQKGGFCGTHKGEAIKLCEGLFYFTLNT